MNTRSALPPLESAAAGFALVLSPVLAHAATASPPVADDIRDIRPLIPIAPWWHWPAACLGAALLVLLGYALVRYLRRRAERALTPEQRALRALDQAEELARAGQCREWAELVASTLRAALSSRLERETCPETTSELAALDWSQLPHGQSVDVPALLELLSTCDLTRFAQGRLDPDALLTETQRSRRWVSRLFAAPETSTPHVARATVIEASS